MDLATHSVRSLPSPMTNYVLGLEFGPHDLLAASDAGHVILYSRLHATRPRVRDISRATSPSG